jgi:hypothetical protein
MKMDSETFLNEVCNLASAYLASQTLNNLSGVIANIEANKLDILEKLKQLEELKEKKK